MNKLTSSESTGSAMIIVIIVSSFMLTQLMFISRSINLYRLSIIESYFESSLKYAALSGLAFVPNYIDVIPNIDSAIRKDSDVYQYLSDAYKLDNIIDEVTINLLRHQSVIYSIATHKDRRYLTKYILNN